MSTVTAPQIFIKHPDETINCAIDARGLLDSGEAYTGTPTIAEEATSVLTISNKAVSTAALTIRGVSVPAGEAIQCSVVGGVDGALYVIAWSCPTDSTPAQTRKGKFRIRVLEN